MQRQRILKGLTSKIVCLKHLIVGGLIAGSFLDGSALGQAVAYVGTITTSTLGHTFSPASAARGPMVRDFFIDQRQSSSGGGLIGPVSANFDTQSHFALTITAPPGHKYLIRVPQPGGVQFGGRLSWSTPDGSYVYDSGSVRAIFSDLSGNAPSFANAGAMIAQNHAAFEFSSLNSSSLSADISFTSITLIGTAATHSIGTGVMHYHPSTNLPNEFYAVYYPPSGQSSDPGSFVSIVPMLTLQIAKSAGGVTISWPTHFGTWVLEATTQLDNPNGWSAVTNSRVIVGANYFVTNTVSQPTRYYRMRRN